MRNHEVGAARARDVVHVLPRIDLDAVAGFALEVRQQRAKQASLFRGRDRREPHC